jgi:ribose 5-phosphate isomerase A
MTTLEGLKRLAAERAVEQVQSGMVVGLGTGSTAVYAVRRIGQLLADGRLQDILAIPTSEATAREAEQCAIPLVTLDDQPLVTLTIDGADEIDPQLNLIKGLGGALLREKVVAIASRRLIVVADASKQVNRLGDRAPLPVEVIPFARRPVSEYLTALGARVSERLKNGELFITDEGNILLDCYFGPIADAEHLAQTIRAQPGVVEHGLFLGIASQAIVASEEGIVVLNQQ